MLVSVLTLLLTVQAQTQPPVPTAGPPLSPVPHTPVVRRTGDADVLGAIGAADANMIEAATLATTKASNGEVKSYAALVLRDHQKSLTAGTKLAKELRITRLLPADSAMARAQVEAMTRLNLLSGDAFDRAFVQYTVDAHQVLVTKDKTVLPARAQRRRVKNFLHERQEMLQAHLQAGVRWLGR